MFYVISICIIGICGKTFQLTKKKKRKTMKFSLCTLLSCIRVDSFSVEKKNHRKMSNMLAKWKYNFVLKIVYNYHYSIIFTTFWSCWYTMNYRYKNFYSGDLWDLKMIYRINTGKQSSLSIILLSSWHEITIVPNPFLK